MEFIGKNLKIHLNKHDQSFVRELFKFNSFRGVNTGGYHLWYLLIKANSLELNAQRASSISFRQHLSAVTARLARPGTLAPLCLNLIKLSPDREQTKQYSPLNGRRHSRVAGNFQDIYTIECDS